MNAVPQVNKTNVFDVAERVIAGGAYAQFSQQDQLAVCLFVSELRPRPDEQFRVTITAGTTALSVEETARRMNLAKAAAETVLAGRPVPPPDSISHAIGLVTGCLASVRAAQKDSPSAIKVVAERQRLYDAIDELTKAFEKEFYDGR